MRTVCPSWILSVACAGFSAMAVGCGDDDPTEVECPAGYIAFRVEADAEEYVCTKATEAVCTNEELVPILMEDGGFVCTEPRACGENDVAVQQEDGTFRCITTIQVECDEGKVAMEAANGSFACIDEDNAECAEGMVPLANGSLVTCVSQPNVSCADGMVAVMGENGILACVETATVECDDGMLPLQGADGTVACVSQVNLSCDDGMVPVESDGIFACVETGNIECDAGLLPVQADDGTVSCVSQVDLSCDDGMVAMEGSDGLFGCVEIDTVECGDGLLPVQAADGSVSCVSQVNLSCDDGMVPVEGANGFFACVETTTIQCSDGTVPVQDFNGGVSCVAATSIDCDAGSVPMENAAGVYACVAPVEISCADGMVPTTTNGLTYACRNPLIVDCEAGQVTTQQADGTYACIALDEMSCPSGELLVQGNYGAFSCQPGLVDEMNPGTIGCPAGTTLNEEMLACIRMEQIECPADYVAVSGGSAGWQCINFQSGDVDEIVVDGRVRDEVTNIALAGVQVTLLGLVDVDGTTIVTTTDENGYFTASGFANGRRVTAALALEGYLPRTQTHDFDARAVDGSQVITQPEDFSFGGSGEYAEGYIDLVPVPANNLVVAGTLFANQQIAAGVQVQLLSCETDGELTQYATQSVTSGADGTFVFEAVADGCYIVNVGQFDIDGDGTPDYRIQEQRLELLSTETRDIGNLQLVLQPYHAADVVFTSLRLIADPPGGEVPASALGDLIGDTFLMPTGDTEITFQLSDPLDPASIIVELYAVEGGAVVRQIPVTATVGGVSNTLLTVTPGEALAGDSDPTTLYAIRFRQLAWANGEFVQLPTGGNGTSDIFIDVRTPLNYLPNPTAFALYWGNNPDAATGVIDSGNAWDLAPSGVAIANRAFGGVQMSWTLATGATGYELYARWSNRDGNFDEQTWEHVQSFGAFGDPNSNIGTTAWGTVDLPAVFALAVADVDAEWNAPYLAYDRSVQLTLVSVNADGDESPIDPANFLALSDSVLLGLDFSTPIGLTSQNLLSPATELEYELTFSEQIRSTFTPALTPIAATSVIRANDAFDTTQDWEWDNTDPWQDAGTRRITVTDGRRDACVQVDANVPPTGQGYFQLDPNGDTRLFGQGASLIGLNPGAPQMNNGAAITVSSVETNSGYVWTASTLTGRDGPDADTLPDQNALNANDWVCAGTFPTTAAAEAMGAIMLTFPAGSTTSISSFYVGQYVCFVPTNTDPVACSTVRSIDYAGNRLFFQYQDSNPADPAVNTNLLLNPPAGSRVIRFGDAADFTGVQRDAEQIDLIQTVAANTATINLRVALGDLAAIGAAPGDRVLIDQDGDWMTTADRSIATVTQVARQLDTTVNTNLVALREDIVVGTVTPAYAAGVNITTESVIILLGNTAMAVSNMNTAADSSGNSPATTFYDQFAICGAGITDNEGNTICNAGESFVF